MLNRLKLFEPEKKRWLTTPVTVTQGDIIGIAPYINAFFNNTGLTLAAPPLAIGQQFAQSTANSLAGWSAWDVTPYPQEGVGYAQRIGGDITVVSAYHKFQLWDMPSNNSRMRLKFLYVIPGIPVQSGGGLSTFVNSMFLTSPFPQGTGINAGSSFVDYNSPLDPDFMGQYKIIRKKLVTLPADKVSGQITIKEVNVPFKFKNGHKVRYSDDTTAITSGQIICIVLADCGNISPTNAFTGNGSQTMPINVANSGCYMNFQMNTYYYDN